MSRTGTVEAISAELKEVKDEIKQRKQYLDHAQRASETAEFMALPEAERLVRLQTLKFDREVTLTKLYSDEEKLKAECMFPLGLPQ